MNQFPKIIQLSKDNIADEHICCAFSDKKCHGGYQAKKDWLIEQFAHGYVFKKFDVRGKAFIEYVPAEKAWAPIVAPGYMFIHCFWVSGKFKNKGMGKRLFEECLKEAENMNGIAVISSKTKRPFMSDKSFFLKQGFVCCDTANPYFELLVKPFKKDTALPYFTAKAKNGQCANKNGISVFYSPACPFNDYYVQTVLADLAKKHNIAFQSFRIDSLEKAQNHIVPHTLYSVFYNGEFISHQILSEKSFEKIFAKRR